MIEAILIAFFTPIAVILGLAVGFYALIKLVMRALK